MRMFHPLLCTVIVMTIAHAIGEVDLNVHSIKSEEEALLKFKEGFKNPSNQLSSWDTRIDFCTWAGVECNATTGHVISLDLHSSNSSDKLHGELSSSLLDLPYLSYLNLSGNDFMQSQVPVFLGSMQNLKHLNLSSANFKGNLPHTLGNLSQLESLDLSFNGFSLKANNLKWLHGLSKLKILDLSGVDLSSSADDWFGDISMLPSLVILRLSFCNLLSLPPSPPEVKFDSLITLDLSFNYFNSTIPDWLFENCHNLQYLDLSNNQLQGPIPDSIERLMSLEALDMSNNNLNGLIPSTLGQAGTNSFLKELHLSNNQLNGSLERSLGQLSNLVVLDLADNKLVGSITDAHLDNFTSLRVLDLSSNRITLNVSKSWVPPFQLETIGLGNCQLGPQFPNWIQTQKNLSHINISHAGVSDIVPNWFWDLSPSIEYMDLSFNELRGCGLDFSSKFKLHTLLLSNNNFSCPLPHLPPNMKTLDLATNSFYGNISHICDVLGVNSSLTFLYLSSNNLSGSLPNCWKYGKNMVTMNLENNHFSGSIPDSLGSLPSLRALNLYGNYISGEIPEALKSCKGLNVLDLGNNQLSGPVPYWIGEEMQMLKALVLRRNTFEGNIPTVLCQLMSLQILDLSMNQLTGAIPPCVLAATATLDSERSYKYGPNFPKQLLVMKFLDLSSNELNGNIPREITKINGLVSLNLSRNQLVGSIPSNIGELKELESLDLSRNQLSCVIPNSMLNLTFLSYLNLSYNNLSGQIPIGNQLSTFDTSSYEGNPLLCGPPLTKPCPRDMSFENQHCSDREYDDNHQDDTQHSGAGHILVFHWSLAVLGLLITHHIFRGMLISVS